MRSILTILLVLSSLSLVAQQYVDTVYSVATQRDVVYGTAVGFGGREDTLRLDVSHPIDDGMLACGRPLLVLVHGGGWIAGDKDEGYITRMREDFAKRGYTVASIAYRLGMFPTDRAINCNVPDWNCTNKVDSSEWYRANYRAIQDVHGAIRYLINHADQYQINPNNVFLAGESAGAFVVLGVGLVDDPSEIESDMVGALPAAPAPNPLYERSCLVDLDLAPSIASLDLARPALGDIKGNLNLPLQQPYQVQAIGAIYGGVFNDILHAHVDPAPALYLYHQPCDLIAPIGHQRIFAGFNACFQGFPANCQNIINRPYVYGSRGLANLIDELRQQGVATSDYMLDLTTANNNCLQQLDPAQQCHALDNYWLRTSNMAVYFAAQVQLCTIDTEDAGATDQSALVLVPNPARSVAYLQLKHASSEVEIRVVDITGRQQEVPVVPLGLRLELQLGALTAGTYYVQVVDKGGLREVLRLVKVK